MAPTQALLPHQVRGAAPLTREGCRFYAMLEGTQSWENKTQTKEGPCRRADSCRHPPISGCTPICFQGRSRMGGKIKKRLPER